MGKRELDPRKGENRDGSDGGRDDERALRSGRGGGGRREGTRNKYRERGGCIIRVCEGGFSLTPHVVYHGAREVRGRKLS